MKAKPILRIPNTRLGEGPVWDYRTQQLWWVDISHGLVHCYDPQSHNNQTYSIGQMVGAVIPCEKEGTLILAMEHGFAFFNPSTEQLTAISDPEEHLAGNRFNDAKCDPVGRLWAGTMMMTKPRQAIGSLYCLDTDLNVSKKLSGITVSNGLAWNKAADSMYYVDSPTQKVQAFAYDLETGKVEQVKDALQFDSIFPDGMCIDRNDHLWIAFYWAGMVGCFDPVSGEQLAKIEVSATRTTSCAFGGPDLDTLYITSATGDEHDEIGGTLYAIKPGVKGRKANFFKMENG